MHEKTTEKSKKITEIKIYMKMKMPRRNKNYFYAHFSVFYFLLFLVFTRCLINVYSFSSVLVFYFWFSFSCSHLAQRISPLDVSQWTNWTCDSFFFSLCHTLAMAVPVILHLSCRTKRTERRPTTKNKKNVWNTLVI